MSDEAKADDSRESWGRYFRRHALELVAGMVIGGLLVWVGIQPQMVVVVAPNKVVVAGDGDDFTPTFGWVPDAAVIKDNLDPVKTTQFDATPAGRAVMQADGDVYLWREVRKAGGFAVDRYPNVNQRNVGCCVGCGWKHGIDTLLAVQSNRGAREQWKPVSVEVIYGGSRVEVGGGRISGDGSVGAWAAKWVSTYGVVPMEKHGAIDLTEFSPARAREYGRAGCPDSLEPQAREHPVKGTALVKSWADVKRAIGQGYPVVICSDQGFRMERGAGGLARPQGSWAHCMVCLGTRSGTNEGGFILNSWGDAAHTGPVYPEDMPVAGFWADSATIDRMVRQGDSFAISDATGFPARKLDWFITAPRPARRPDVFAALVPDLAW